MKLKNQENIIWDDFKISENEIDMLKDYFKRYGESLNHEFSNSIEENIIKMKSFSSESYNRMVFKGIIVMQKNWAEDISQFDKLYEKVTIVSSKENIIWDDFKISENEIDILKDYFKRYGESLNQEFSNSIEENIIKMKSFSTESYNPMIFKGIIIMQKNWAKNIYELDKLSSNTLEINKWEYIEELINKIEVKQEKDLNEALILSEKIKGGEI